MPKIKKKTAKPKDIASNKATAKQVADVVELDGIHLEECQCNRTEVVDATPPAHADIVVEVVSELSTDHDSIRIAITFSLMAKYDVSKEGWPMIKATFHVFYRSTRKLTFSKEEISIFGQTTAIFSVWPYWRELAQSMTLRMGLPAFTTPLFRINDVRDSKKASVKSKRIKSA